MPSMPVPSQGRHGIAATLCQDMSRHMSGAAEMDLFFDHTGFNCFVSSVVAHGQPQKISRSRHGFHVFSWCLRGSFHLLVIRLASAVFSVNDCSACVAILPPWIHGSVSLISCHMCPTRTSRWLLMLLRLSAPKPPRRSQTSLQAQSTGPKPKH